MVDWTREYCLVTSCFDFYDYVTRSDTSLVSCQCDNIRCPLWCNHEDAAAYTFARISQNQRFLRRCWWCSSELKKATLHDTEKTFAFITVRSVCLILSSHDWKHAQQVVFIYTSSEICYQTVLSTPPYRYKQRLLHSQWNTMKACA